MRFGGHAHAELTPTRPEADPAAVVWPAEALPDPVIEPSALARWWRSRAGKRLLIEIAICAGLLFVYKTVRYYARGQVEAAFHHGREVIRFERALGIFNEVSLQKFALQNVAFIKFLNRYYVFAHFTTTIIVLAWLYLRHPSGYLRARRLVIVMTAVAMVIHVGFPLAPPRMFSQFGFVDTAQLFGPNTYGKGLGGVANQFAAMPSLHFGWSVIMAWAVIKYSRRHVRWVMLLHPLLTLSAIVLTANHYWLDACVAGLLFLLGLVVDRQITRWRRTHPRQRRLAYIRSVA